MLTLKCNSALLGCINKYICGVSDVSYWSVFSLKLRFGALLRFNTSPEGLFLPLRLQQPCYTAAVLSIVCLQL